MKIHKNSRFAKIFGAIENPNFKLFTQLYNKYFHYINNIKNEFNQNLLVYALSIFQSKIIYNQKNEMILRKIISYLVKETRININFKDVNGINALIHTILNNDKETFLLLIERGADINNQDQNQEFPLGSSFFISREEEVFDFSGYLVAKGANINYQSSLGETALHISISFSNYDKIDILLKEKRLNINIQNNEGQTPLCTLINNINDENYAEIFENQLIEKFMHHGSLLNLKILKVFLEKKQYLAAKYLNIQDCSGNSFLHIAAANNRSDLAEKLLKLGADQYLANNSGNLPLHIAAEKDNLDLILSVYQTADLEITNSKSETAIQLLAKVGFEKYKSIITSLTHQRIENGKKSTISEIFEANKLPHKSDPPIVSSKKRQKIEYFM